MNFTADDDLTTDDADMLFAVDSARAVEPLAISSYEDCEVLAGVDQAPAALPALVEPAHEPGNDDADVLDADDLALLGSLSEIVGVETPAPARAEALLLTRETGLKVNQWDLSFGPVSGPAGKQTSITVRPQCLFRGEKIMATDTASPAGTGTRIVQVAVGQKIQRPAVGNGSLTAFFAQNALANGIRFDTAQRWADIVVTVSFIQDCTFEMSVFGTTVVDE